MTSSSVRRQASLFLTSAAVVEAVRLQFNPAQARLIPAHVTLCREDEVEDWSRLEARIRALLPVRLTLGFGPPTRDGDLVLMPAIDGVEQFDELRFRLLSDADTPPRKHSPHLTLIHPRNGTCTDAIFREIVHRTPPFSATFEFVSLIEQVDGGPWRPFATLGSPDKT